MAKQSNSSNRIGKILINLTNEYNQGISTESAQSLIRKAFGEEISISESMNFIAETDNNFVLFTTTISAYFHPTKSFESIGSSEQYIPSDLLSDFEKVETIKENLLSRALKVTLGMKVGNDLPLVQADKPAPTKPKQEEQAQASKDSKKESTPTTEPVAEEIAPSDDDTEKAQKETPEEDNEEATEQGNVVTEVEQGGDSSPEPEVTPEPIPEADSSAKTNDVQDSAEEELEEPLISEKAVDKLSEMINKMDINQQVALLSIKKAERPAILSLLKSAQGYRLSNNLKSKTMDYWIEKILKELDTLYIELSTKDEDTIAETIRDLHIRKVKSFDALKEYTNADLGIKALSSLYQKLMALMS